jgi:hypothetical protein
MHYTGMAALRVEAAPGLTVSTSATASASAFLLPLILGLSSVGFIFSAVIALSPTAAEIVEEDELMKRISQSQAARYEPQSRQAYRAAPGTAQRPPGTAQRPAGTALPGAGWQAQPGAGWQAQPGTGWQAQPGEDEPGSLFRPRRPRDHGPADQ